MWNVKGACHATHLSGETSFKWCRRTPLQSLLRRKQLEGSGGPGHFLRSRRDSAEDAQADQDEAIANMVSEGGPDC